MFQKFHASKIILMIGLLSSQNSIGQNVIRLTTQTISVRDEITVESVQTFTSGSTFRPIKFQLAEKQNSNSKLKFSKKKSEKLPELSIKTADELYFVKDGSLKVQSFLSGSRKISDSYFFSSKIFSIGMNGLKQLEVLLSNGAVFLIDTETSSIISIVTVGNKPDSEFNMMNSYASTRHAKTTICCVQKDGPSSKNDRYKFFAIQQEITSKISSFDSSAIKITSDQNIWCAVTGRLYEQRSTSNTGDLHSSLALSTVDSTSFNLTTSISFQPNPILWDLQTYFI